ncbi:MAG: PTS sugar transporter subunit IIC [Faecalibacillus sp.]
MIKKLEKVFMPLAEAIGKNKYLMSIRDGFLVSTPLLIIGSIFLLIGNFPITAWTDFIAEQGWAGFIGKPASATFDIMAILAVIGIAYAFAGRMNVDKIFGAATALVSWFILMPFSIDKVLDTGEAITVSGIPFAWVGSKGIFIGIACAFLAVHIYSWVNSKGWIIKMPEGVPPTVEQSFSALIPAGITITVFFALNWIFALTPYGSAFQFVFEILQAPLLSLGNTLGAMVIAYIFLHFFWFFGVNGGSVVGAVFNPILQSLSIENAAALQAGLPIPNIISQQFQDLFATFGGCGSTLSLLIAMLLFCKSKRVTELAKLSLVPGIFGINEPIVFGLPIVLNPTILIPFMLVPTMNIVISYIVMSIGLVPYCNGIQLPWTTPVIISGFLSTNWAGAVLQAVLLVLGVFVYLPFIKIIDKQYLQEEANASTQNNEEDDFSLDDLNFDDL